MRKPTFNFKKRILRAAYTLLSLAVLLPAAAEAKPVVTISGCPNFKTFTQGAWGANPSGTNPASFLSANFATAFPSGLTLGCTNKIVLTSATAVHNFLPQGSTARALNPGTLTNPSSSAYNNVLAGQLAAAIINVTFGSAFSSFAPASANLKDLVISSGPFFNKNVSQVINFANQIIGGCSSAYSATDLNTALTAINSSYDNGTMAGNYLACPIQVTSTKNNVTCNHGNNGSICITSVSFNTHGFTISNTNKNFLLRIIQEFLSNSLKHSECKNILLDFKYTSDGLQAIIKDDGKGFDLNNLLRKPKEGIGLLNMKKRAELIGASFSLSSIVGDGTTLRIFIPQSKLNV